MLNFCNCFLSVQIISIKGFHIPSQLQCFFCYSCPSLFKLSIVIKMLNSGTSFSVQNISINGVQIHYPLQCFLSFSAKGLLKLFIYKRNA